MLAAAYSAPVIDKVHVSTAEDDVGIIVGTGTSTLKIPYNSTK